MSLQSGGETTEQTFVAEGCEFVVLKVVSLINARKLTVNLDARKSSNLFSAHFTKLDAISEFAGTNEVEQREELVEVVLSWSACEDETTGNLEGVQLKSE